MVSSTTVDEGTKAKTRVSWNVLQLSVGIALFLSLVLLLGSAYFSLRCQVQQLRADVDQLKAVHSLSLTPAAAAGLLGDDHGDEASSPDLQRRRRSKREDTFNESTARNDTSVSEDKEEDGSGEFTDNQYPGIWMGTYSRVPVS